MANQPLVSVIMPAYNAERTISQAIESVLGQTYSDLELLVIDDGSMDGTPAIVRKYAEIDSRVSFLPNEQNMGVAKTRNRGMALAKGVYIALLDSDDYWLPQKLERQLQCARDTGADIIYCSYAIVDENGEKKHPDFIVPDRADFESTLIKSTISCSTVMLSAQLVEQYKFPTAMYHEDLAYWLQLLQNGAKAAGVTDVLAAYRVVAGSRASNKLKSAINRWKVYRNFLGLPLLRSAALLVQYTVLGLMKYR